MALLRRAVLIAVPSTVVGISGCGPCADPLDQIYLLRNPDAETQALIDACRAPVNAVCTPLCQKVSGATSFAHCEVHLDSNGYVQVHVGQTFRCPGGRRPRGLRLRSARQANAPVTKVGAFFATQFQLEAASIPAFQGLRDELHAFGAPEELARAASCAAKDEIRHARALARLARRYHSALTAPRVVPGPVRSLEALAVENAVEGCVRETYGAALAMAQSRRAEDPAVGATMRVIAGDEARHAALAFAVDTWIQGRVSVAARRRIRDARATAVDQLLLEIDQTAWEPELGRGAGLPAPNESRRLLQELRETVWA